MPAGREEIGFQLSPASIIHRSRCYFGQCVRFLKRSVFFPIVGICSCTRVSLTGRKICHIKFEILKAFVRCYSDGPAIVPCQILSDPGDRGMERNKEIQFSLGTALHHSSAPFVS